MNLISAKTKEQILNIKKLYNKSFPPKERKPFNLILKFQAEGKGELFEIREDDNFAGFVVNTMSDQSILLDYLAISPEYQNQGLGSKIVKLWLEKYKDMFLFCEIETTKKFSDNAEERQRRKIFYLKNGFSETRVNISLWGVEMELLSNRSDAVFEDYYEIYYNAYGKDYSIN